MRISIREQLALVVCLTSLVALTVISVATWVNNYNFVVGIRQSRLALTASLKTGQLNSNLLLLQSSVVALGNSIVIQNALQRYNDQGNNSVANWIRAEQDIQPALSGGGVGETPGSLLQTIIWPKNNSGLNGPYGLLNVTGQNVGGLLKLNETNANGTDIFLGDPGPGYPPQYYPNITYTSEVVNSTYNASIAYDFNLPITRSAPLLLGPFLLNSTFAFLSLTIPVINNTSSSDILGYMTVLMSADTISRILLSPEGLDKTGQTLLIGPDSTSNRFDASKNPLDKRFAKSIGEVDVQFVLPPMTPGRPYERHPSRKDDTAKIPFKLKDYPAAFDALTLDNRGNQANNAGSLISSKNEDGKAIAVGYAVSQSRLVDWVLLMEEDKSEAFAPIHRLRNVLLACVFGTAGVILLIVFPLAHVSVRPIRRLRDATKNSVMPPGYATGANSPASGNSRNADLERDFARPPGQTEMSEKKSSLRERFPGWLQRSKASKEDAEEDARRRSFRIPGKVHDGKHFILDELTDLTQTFNEMTEELMMQYEKLEERVQERTRKLELSMKAAEAANESKTLFIANISHELKTPLNGILGMTAVCMQEDDLPKIKRSLGIIYKSGDLLLHLLTDLLTFSKNQIGQQLNLEEKAFRLGDISTQILNIFEKQANEGKIHLQASFSGPDSPSVDLGFAAIGARRIRDMCVWGDQNRILQVIINLVSNSLKFTPPGGSVDLRIRCVAEAEPEEEQSRRGSMSSRHATSKLTRRPRLASGSDASISDNMPARSGSDPGRPREWASSSTTKGSKSYPQVLLTEKPSTPPNNTKTLIFEIEVEDTGPGIPEHLQERVFDPFVQGDLGLSKKYGGTGLGLSICSQLAKLMKGSIRLRSEVDSGSTFTMRIPLKYVKEIAESLSSSSVNIKFSRDGINHTSQVDDYVGPKSNSDSDLPLRQSVPNAQSPTYETAAKPRLVGLSQPFFAPEPTPSSSQTQISVIEKAASTNSAEPKRVRVLIAEDNKVNQEVVMRMLKLEDIYDITVAKDGQEAFDMVKESMENEESYNLIFMDVQMPNLDGLQSTRLIREMGYSAPIVALTAFAEESNIKECMASGMDFFLSKPIRRSALKQVLKAYCPTIPEETEMPSPKQKTEDTALGSSKNSRKPSSNGDT